MPYVHSMARGFVLDLRARTGQSMDIIEKSYPLFVALARQYDREWRKNYRKEHPARGVAVPTMYDRMTWIEILDGVKRYKDWREQRITLDSTEADIAREIRGYYPRVYRADRVKRLKYPDIVPTSLGYDPRLRRWPNGTIALAPRVRQCHGLRRAPGFGRKLGPRRPPDASRTP